MELIDSFGCDNIDLQIDNENAIELMRGEINSQKNTNCTNWICAKPS